MTGTWTTAYPIGNRLLQFNIFDDIISNKMYIHKLQHMLGLRADVSLKLQINAQPFHAGRLMLVWVPFYRSLGERKQYYNGGSAEMMTPLSGCPHVDLDLSAATEATIHIPYISPRTFYNIPQKIGNLGTFFVYIYAPLRDVIASGEVEYTLWASLDNIHIEFPTGISIAQVGNEGATQVQRGIIETVASCTSTALRAFNDIPVIGDFTRPASWVSSTVEDIARLFGWSKPYNVSELQIVRNIPGRFMANADGSDLSENLSVIANNEIEQNNSFFRTDVDEMSIAHIVRTPNFFQTFQWKTNSRQNTILFTKNINLSDFINQCQSYYVPTHLSYIANNFTLWRGGVNFIFKFVKTKFHSGRVRIVYVPSDYSDGTSIDQITLDACYSAVVDVRSQTDVTFNVPFVSCQPWLSVLPFDRGMQSTTGRLYVLVLNELVANANVSSTMDVLVEVAGAEDVEFAMPVIGQFYPCSTKIKTPYTAKVGKEVIDATAFSNTHPKLLVEDTVDDVAYTFWKNSDTISNQFTTTPTPSLTSTLAGRLARNVRISTAQVGNSEGPSVPFELQSEVGTTSQPEVDNHQSSTGFVISANTIGEKVVSLRQLLKTFKFKDELEIPGKEYVLRYQPDYIERPLNDNESIYVCDFYDIFGYLYAFRRGGMRTKTLTTDKTMAYVMATPFYGCENSQRGTVYMTKSAPRGVIGCSATKMLTEVERLWELQHPFYSMYPFLINRVAKGRDRAHINAGFYSFNSAVVELSLTDAVTKAKPFRVGISRAISDDFSFAGLLGAPCVAKINIAYSW